MRHLRPSGAMHVDSMPKQMFESLRPVSESGLWDLPEFSRLDASEQPV